MIGSTRAFFLLPIAIGLALLPALSGCGGGVDRAATGDDVVNLSLSGKTGGFIVGTPGDLGLRASGGAGNYEWSCTFSDEPDRARFAWSQEKENFSIGYDGGTTLSGFITITVRDGKNVGATHTVPVNYPAEGLVLESDRSGDGRALTVGIADQLNFSASGGSGSYTWEVRYSEDIHSGQFHFSGERNSASLVYDGGETLSGIITVVLGDSAGHSAALSIPLAYGQEGLVLSSSCGADCHLSSGTEGHITFSASGGSGTYDWRVDFGENLARTEFAFAGSGNSAVLMYGGGLTDSGVIQVTLADSAGAGKTQAVAVIGGESYAAELTLSPETVDVNGEVLASVALKYASGEPVVGESIVFRIDEGPAAILDGNGDAAGASSEGQRIVTDAQGRSHVRIRAGETASTTRVLVRASWRGGGTGCFVAGEVTIRRGLGYLRLLPGSDEPYPGHAYSATYEYAGGTLAAGQLSYELPFRVLHTDGNGNPFANQKVRLSTGQRTSSIASLTLSGGELPASLTTDGDGETEFILHVTTKHGEIPANSKERNIGAFVLTAEDANGLSGSYAVGLCVTTGSDDAVTAITIAASATQLTSGVSNSVSFTASGGTGAYRWSISHGASLTASHFSMTSSNDAALLVYDGTATPAGTIVLSVTDGDGHSASAVVGVVTTSTSQSATLEIVPDEVDVGGEVICRYRLVTGDESPVAGSAVVFQILQGPAYFIDTDGDNIGTRTDGGVTDATGTAFARVRAGESEDATHVVVKAVSGSGVVATQSFTVNRDLGTILFESEGPPIWEHRGDFEAGTIYWALPVVMTHTDGSGKPLANEAVTIEAYLPTTSIASVSLGDALFLPATVMTDDDGKSEFVLEVAVTHGFIAEDTGPVSIGSLVLTGETTRNVRGSLAMIFEVQTIAVADVLSISPESLDVRDGQVAGFSSSGGAKPYAWTLSGAGELVGATDGASVVYRASTPAASATIIVHDADGKSVSANITPAENP